MDYGTHHITYYLSPPSFSLQVEVGLLNLNLGWSKWGASTKHSMSPASEENFFPEPYFQHQLSAVLNAAEKNEHFCLGLGQTLLLLSPIKEQIVCDKCAIFPIFNFKNEIN